MFLGVALDREKIIFSTYYPDVDIFYLILFFRLIVQKLLPIITRL